MKIIVSQSGKQYTYELLKALNKAGHEVIFITLFWYDPQNRWWKFLKKVIPVSIGEKLEKKLIKKFDPELQGIKVIQAPIIELLRIATNQISLLKNGEQSQFYFDRWHDCFVAKKIGKLNFDLLVGYEMSSRNSFKIAKKKSAKTVLDLAQIHFKEIESLAQNHQSLYHLRSNTFRTKVNQVKEEEYQLADHIISLSKFAEESLVKYGINPSKVSIANLGFNPHIFFPQKKKIKNFDAEPLKVLFVGSIIKRKGFIELLNAVSSILQESNLKIEVDLVGGLVDKSDLDALKSKLNFRHFPNQSHQKLKIHYQEADVFIFPSLLDSWAMVVLESMACGTPVIVTPNTGASDAVRKYGGGKVIEAGSVKAIKEAIYDYLQHPTKLQEDSLLAAQTAQHYEWSSYHQVIQNVFNRLDNAG